MSSETSLTRLLEDPIVRLPNPKKSGALQLPPLQDLIHASRPLPLEPSASSTSNSHTDVSKLPHHGISSKQSESSKKPEKAHKPGSRKGTLSSEESQDKTSPTRDTGSKLGHEDWSALNHNKRRRIDASGVPGQFLQLPKPPEKRSEPPQFTPPILIGLHEPPPNAALFPPIAPNDGSIQSLKGPTKITPLAKNLQFNLESKGSSTQVLVKPRQRPAQRIRRRWSDQETDDLLQGVAIYGVGSWKKILSHPSFNFHDRTAVDLKDRFRTCRPEDYRSNSTPNSNGKNASSSPPEKSKSSPLSRPLTTPITPDQERLSSPTTSTPRQSRRHHKNVEDLARLGIEGPFPKAQRRHRRPFTDEEDIDLLKGYNIHGPHWSQIQSDPKLNLEGRKPTDLRDRFRIRYPEKYEEAGFKGKKKPTNENPSIIEPNLVSNVSTDEQSLSKGKERSAISLPMETSISSNEDDNPMSLNNIFDWADNNLSTFTSFSDDTPTASQNKMPSLQLLTKSSGPDNALRPLTKRINTEPSQQWLQTIHPPTLSSLVSASSNSNQSQKPVLTLPPPTDLLPLDFDTLPPFQFNLKAVDISKYGLTTPGESGEKRNLASLTSSLPSIVAGSATVDAQSTIPLLWEDMATHPIFDIDEENVAK